MDSEHRHELKENDLAEFLTNFGSWWSRYGNLVLTVVLIAVIAYTATSWYKNRAAESKERAWRELADTTSPDGYRAVALSNQDPTVRALAFLRGADQLLAESIGSESNANDGPSSDPDPTESAHAAPLDQAAMMYQQVVDDPQAHLVYKLNAQMGLGAVAENRHDWEEAKKIYSSVSESARSKYTTIAQLAQTRMALLERLEQPVVFAPDPPTTQPAGFDTMPALQDNSPLLSDDGPTP